MGSSAKPATPVDPAKTYSQGIQTNLKFAPQIQNAEQKMRAQYDGASVAQNLQNQQQSGGAFLNLYRQNLAQVDPGQAVDSLWGQQASNDLAKGYQLSGDQTRQVQQTTRAQQVDTGNILGNAAVSKEATAVGKASFAAYQQRLSNAGSFLSHDNAVTFATAMQKLTTGATLPDRSMNYVSGSSGLDAQSLLNQTYQEDLQYVQNYNPDDYLGGWQRMAQGAYIGLREGWQGGSLFGPVIGAFGAVGGALGGSFQGLINAPDYRFNVQYSGYAIYGVPWQKTAISVGEAVASGAASAYIGSATTAAQIANTAAQAGISAAGTYGQNYYSNGG